MRTAPVFIPEKKPKQTITDLKVQQRDNRARLSWKINQTERINRLKNFDLESGERDYFLIHQKLIELDCRDCEPSELTDLKVMIYSDLLIQDGNHVFYYLQFPENALKIHFYKISHFGPDGEKFSNSQFVRLRNSNVFPKLPVPELEIVKIEDVKLKDAILLEGLPGVGNVGKLAAMHLIEELKAKHSTELQSLLAEREEERETVKKLYKRLTEVVENSGE